MRDMNLRNMKMRHHVAGVENARHENAKNAIVCNTECCICLSIAEHECMSRQERAPDFAVCIPARQKLHEIAPDFQPNQVIADFEEAPAAAIRAVYGNDLTVSGYSAVCLHYRCCRLPTSTQHSRTSRCWSTTIRRQRHCCCNCVAKSSVSGSTSHPLARHECPSAAIPRALTTLLKVFTRLCDDV